MRGGAARQASGVGKDPGTQSAAAEMGCLERQAFSPGNVARHAAKEQEWSPGIVSGKCVITRGKRVTAKSRRNHVAMIRKIISR